MIALEDGDFVLSLEEIVIGMEVGARERLGLTAEDMVDAYHLGVLPPKAEVIDLLGLGYLLPEEHPLHVRLDG